MREINHNLKSAHGETYLLFSLKANSNTDLAPIPFGFSNGQVSPALGANRRHAVSGGQPQPLQQPSHQPTGYRKAASAVTPRTLAAPPRFNRTISRYGPESGEEGFLDIMKSALRTGGPLLGGALRTGLPMALGPLGAPIAALTGLALNAAGQLAELGDAESLDPSEVQEGTMERAILAEAALTAVQTLDLHPEQEEGTRHGSHDGARAAHRLELLADLQREGRQRRGSLWRSNRGAVPFKYHLLGGHRQAWGPRHRSIRLRPQDRHEPRNLKKAFFDIISAGVRFAGRRLTAAARVGLPLLAQMMNEGGAQESAEADPTAPTAALSSSDLAKRALVGEAALQALIKLPPHVLEEEGFFDTIADVIREDRAGRG
ncbi:MAG: hypothetical protein LQ344_005461 [Seirophora lacunosa]|nr:MAG: hypothetical protein LQ344_005461 [Seirophora lacunosa]